MWTGMEKTQEVKAEEGDESGDINTNQAVRVLCFFFFPNKIVLYLENNGGTTRDLNIASDSTAQLLPRINR